MIDDFNYVGNLNGESRKILPISPIIAKRLMGGGLLGGGAAGGGGGASGLASARAFFTCADRNASHQRRAPSRSSQKVSCVASRLGVMQDELWMPSERRRLCREEPVALLWSDFGRFRSKLHRKSSLVDHKTSGMAPRAPGTQKSSFLSTLQDAAPNAGDWFSNPDLARTFQRVADGGPEVFYGGELGREIVDGLACISVICKTHLKE